MSPYSQAFPSNIHVNAGEKIKAQKASSETSHEVDVGWIPGGVAHKLFF